MTYWQVFRRKVYLPKCLWKTISILHIPFCLPIWNLLEKLSVITIIKLLTCCIIKSYFQFNNNFDWKTDSLTMGYPLLGHISTKLQKQKSKILDAMPETFSQNGNTFSGINQQFQSQIKIYPINGKSFIGVLVTKCFNNHILKTHSLWPISKLLF